VNWYAIRVRSNHERTVRDLLAGAALEPFLPVRREHTRWSDRGKITERPLFPGYIFARFDTGDSLRVLQTSGVIGLLPHNLSPTPIAERELDALRMITAAGANAAPCDFTPGDDVEVQRGAFAGLRGPVVRTKGSTRVVVNITLLNRAACVEIDAEDLKKAC
jgi:transcription antitermination factor NusG